MSILEQPVSPPGCCFICGATSKKWFFDLDKQAEWWGNIYFCCECFDEISRTAGFGNVQVYMDRNKELESMVLELAGKVGVYESSLLAIQSVSVVPNSFDYDRMANVHLDSAGTVTIGTTVERKSRTKKQTDDSQLDGVREPSADTESDSFELKL